jgi:hypothetical protein
MHTIEREELKRKLERGDHFKLVMVLDEWHFRALHIPGSLHGVPEILARKCTLGFPKMCLIFLSSNQLPIQHILPLQQNIVPANGTDVFQQG